MGECAIERTVPHGPNAPLPPEPSLDTIRTVRVTANQVTLARLVLLPLPVAMVYRNTHAFMLGALFIYIVLGLTDALDGYLARKYGSTALGALLDPVVDKIFLVAGFVPLADFQIMPTTLVFILFIRELAVTALRTIALAEGFSFKTSAIAKLKTTVQMAGSGLILIIWLFPEEATILTILSIAALGFCTPVIVAAVRGRKPGWMAWSSAALGASLPLLRWVLPQRQDEGHPSRAVRPFADRGAAPGRALLGGSRLLSPRARPER